MRSAHTLVLGLALLAPAVAVGMTLDDLTTGKTVHGAPVTVNEMKGKIVYVEYWGTR